MNEIAIEFGGMALTWREALLAAAFLVAVSVALVFRSSRGPRALARQVDELTRLQGDMTVRLQSFTEIFGSRQGDFARMLAERIDRGAQHQSETLGRLNERLAVIDAAQANLTELTGQVAGLHKILSNKQTRGAYGQGRMEAIIRDALPPSSYTFQATLSSGARPDCLLHLPGDERAMVIDAKFPLEAFSAFREARGPEARTRAAQKVRADVWTHIRDIAGKYLVPGETQDVALMFVPAESLHADLQEHFEDLVQKAHRARVMIVSPALLALAIQVMQGLVRDARIREEAQIIQKEVGRLVADVVRLTERVERLDQHFRQAQEDVEQIRTSAAKVARRGQKIEALEFDDESVPQSELFEPRIIGRRGP
jgi:DNA recombination protein RmuC